MPGINEYYCTNTTCDFEGPTGWGYYMYAEADDGERIEWPHPGERARAREVIGDAASESEMDEQEIQENLDGQ